MNYKWSSEIERPPRPRYRRLTTGISRRNLERDFFLSRTRDSTPCCVSHSVSPSVSPSITILNCEWFSPGLPCIRLCFLLLLNFFFQIGNFFKNCFIIVHLHASTTSHFLRANYLSDNPHVGFTNELLIVIAVIFSKDAMQCMTYITSYTFHQF